MRKWEYSWCYDDVNPYERDEAMDFGYVYAPDKETAINLAWKDIPCNCTVYGVREVTY